MDLDRPPRPDADAEPGARDPTGEPDPTVGKDPTPPPAEPAAAEDEREEADETSWPQSGFGSFP